MREKIKHTGLNQVRNIAKVYHIAQLKRRQWLNENEIKKRQEEKLRRIIKHAYNNVRYYNELFKSENLRPSDIKTLDDLKKVPILTKESVRNSYPDKIIAKGTHHDKCHISQTTGSSGTPLKVAFSSKDRIFFGASINYVFIESGIKLFDKYITIRDGSFNKTKGLLSKFGVLKTKNISIFNTLDNIIKELIGIKPDIIYTFPSILSLLAQEIMEKKITSIKPRLIWTIGETLTDSLREKLYDIFSSEIISIYASEEFGMLAFECRKHTGYHILTENVVMEFLKDGKDVNSGEKGEVYVTGLSNYTMPLIRYKLGDIAIPIEEKCSCGRGLPMIKNVFGREDDFLILPSGRKISPRMINLIESIPGIKAYKTIQESKDRFLVILVPGKEFNERTIKAVKRQIKIGCLGEQVDVEVKLVKEIKKERTGKIRAIVSKVK